VTSRAAVKYCKGRLAEIDSGRGPAELTGERAAIQEALENLTASGKSLREIQRQSDRLARTKMLRKLNDREASRYATVKATIAIANGTGLYDPAAVTQAMLPCLALFR
jgi:hypothetical protein